MRANNVNQVYDLAKKTTGYLATQPCIVCVAVLLLFFFLL